METEIENTSSGELKIESVNGVIVSISFTGRGGTNEGEEEISKLYKKLKGRAYEAKGTPFQMMVWDEIAKIPVGEVRTYSQIAAAIDRPTSYRAVANACGKNPLALLIPCHRVVAKNGLGGYHWGTDIKKRILAAEVDTRVAFR